MKQEHHTSLRLDPETHATVIALAGRLDRSASWVIRQAIKCGLRTIEESAGEAVEGERTNEPGGRQWKN